MTSSNHNCLDANPSDSSDESFELFPPKERHKAFRCDPWLVIRRRPDYPSKPNDPRRGSCCLVSNKTKAGPPLADARIRMTPGVDLTSACPLGLFQVVVNPSFAPSSNGRTSDFGSENGGSNPPGAIGRDLLHFDPIRNRCWRPRFVAISARREHLNRPQ